MQLNPDFASPAESTLGGLILRVKTAEKKKRNPHGGTYD
jgi:hypothetical protein